MDLLKTEAPPPGAPPATPPVEPVVPPVTPPVEPVVPPVTPPTGDWDSIKASINEELRGDSAMDTINSLDGLVKSYIHGQKAMGKDKISMPDKHSTREDYIDVLRKLGSPEKLDDYKVNIKEEVDKEFVDGFKAAAHKAGLLPWQAEEVVNYIVGDAKSKIDAGTAATDASQEDNIKLLKAEWGEAFEQNIQKANIALDEFLPNADDRKMLSGMSNNTALIKLLAGVSGLMSEDKFIGHGNGQFGKMSPAEALEKARSIQGDKEHPYRNAGHLNHKNAKEEVQNLYKIAYPE